MPTLTTPPTTKPNCKIAGHGLGIIVCLVLILTMGLIGYSIGTKQPENNYKIGYTDGFESAKQKVDDAGIFPTPDTNRLFGTITAISDDQIEIQVDQIIQNPLEEQAPILRTINLTKDTVISLMTNLPYEELQANELAYEQVREQYLINSEESAALLEEPIPPTPYGLSGLKISDLTIGTNIEVVSDKNIALSPAFDALAINTYEINEYVEEDEVEELVEDVE